MSELMDAYWRLLPLARTISTAAFVSSVALYTGFLPAQWIFFHYGLLFKIPPQIWRVLTCFLITQRDLAIILDSYFLYSYLSQLETSNPKFSRREDVVWYLAFVATVILTVDALLGMNSYFYLQALVMALAYTGTQDQRGVKTNFFFLTIPAQLVPYAMMLVSLLMVGPQVVKLQLCGLFAAHLHDFLSRLWPEFGGGSNWLAAPAFVSRLVSPPERRVDHRAYGTAFQAASPSTGTDSGSGPLPDSWRTRGRGQRLGGD